VVNPWPSGPPAVGRPVTNAVAPGAAELARALRPRLRGEVRIDPGVRALYSTDASNYRQLPIAVVTPRDAADVEATLEACSQRGLPVLSRGGGTSLAGQTCNTAVVLDFSRHMNQILQIDLEGRTATVEPGVVLDDLRDALTADGLTFGPDPATHNRCTLGGMIGNNSCGTHSLTTGRTADNVDALEVITYDGVRMWVGATDNGELDRLVTGPGRIGQIYTGLVQLRDRNADLIRQRFPQIPRRVSGYNLDQLLPENHFNLARALVGTEGTCVVVLKAKLRLTSLPPVRRTVVIGFEDAAAAADAVPAVLELKPYGLEGFDDVLMRDVRKLGLHRDGWPLLPDGGGWLLVELGGESEQEVEEDARRLAAAYDSARALTPRQSQHVWGIRESGLGATARVPGEAPTWPGWEDSAVDPFVLGDYLRELRRLYDRYGYHAALYGHYGQGCVHSRVDFDLASADGIATFRTFLDDAADVCVRYGGSLSGEHGDGQARAALLPKMYGPELVDAFGQFKALWDPESKMNPGKVVDPAAPVDNLRLGAHYRPRPLPTTFAFAADDGDFAKAVTRCVGVGACRSHSGTVMCPRAIQGTSGVARPSPGLRYDVRRLRLVATPPTLRRAPPRRRRKSPRRLHLANYFGTSRTPKRQGELASHRRSWCTEVAGQGLGYEGRAERSVLHVRGPLRDRAHQHARRDRRRDTTASTTLGAYGRRLARSARTASTRLSSVESPVIRDVVSDNSNSTGCNWC